VINTLPAGGPRALVEPVLCGRAGSTAATPGEALWVCGATVADEVRSDPDEPAEPTADPVAAPEIEAGELEPEATVYPPPDCGEEVTVGELGEASAPVAVPAAAPVGAMTVIVAVTGCVTVSVTGAGAGAGVTETGCGDTTLCCTGTGATEATVVCVEPELTG
jgi:hypothetical protein